MDLFNKSRLLSSVKLSDEAFFNAISNTMETFVPISLNYDCKNIEFYDANELVLSLCLGVNSAHYCHQITIKTAS